MTNSPTALLVIDMQQGFLDEAWGATTNHPQCESNVVRLLDLWAHLAQPIVVVRHDSSAAGSPLSPTAAGNALMEPVASANADLLVTKSVNSAFYGEPNLELWLRAAGIKRIVVCGIQSNMCVETTARMAGNLGFETIVPIDATRTFDLEGPDGTVVPAATLMAVTATNLHRGGFAQVMTTDEVVSAFDTGRQPRD